MKKLEVIKQLETAKALSSTVDINKVIELIKQIETPTTITAELGSEIIDRIESMLDRNNNYLVDLGSAEFDINYDNRIELTSVDLDVRDIVERVTEIIDNYVELEEEEGVLVDDIVELDRGQESITLADVNKGIELESGGNSYVEF